jgi:hypothetical protein
MSFNSELLSVVLAGINTIRSTILGSTGGLDTLYAEAVSASLSGASGTITLNIPSNAVLLAAQLRVDTAITSGDGGTAWSAAYSGGSTTAIASAKAFAKQTKASLIQTGEITSDTTNVVITCDGGKTFSAGVVRAIVYYRVLTAMGDAA